MPLFLLKNSSRPPNPRRLSQIKIDLLRLRWIWPDFRSFSFNSPHYSPQTIETSASNHHHLVTITHLRQPPRKNEGKGPAGQDMEVGGLKSHSVTCIILEKDDNEVAYEY